ncbi:hypothetical protein [Piscirickettsia salmonis]|uniref:hypothetical protein n=1 Tax=Piscirickettsia salmonis TaxID=1238 RepID=UPI0018AFB289|nr:hypothetical protein [Piscirickettsia salmonis]
MTGYACYRPNGLSQLRSAKNPNLPRPTHPVLSTPWLAAAAALRLSNYLITFSADLRAGDWQYFCRPIR